jgi:hypothetical protein
MEAFISAPKDETQVCLNQVMTGTGKQAASIGGWPENYE